MSRTVRRQALFITVFLVVVILFMFTFRMGVVHGESMAPTYQNEQVVLVRRRNWFSGPLRRGDVVLLRKDRDVIIKRIFRLPGEELDDSYPDVIEVSRHNQLLDYYEQTPRNAPTGRRYRFNVPEGYLVVLGDNLDGSEDSRMFGPVPIRDVLGVVAKSPPSPYAKGVPPPQNGADLREKGGPNRLPNP